MLDEQIDFSHRFSEVGEGAATDRPLSDNAKSPLDQIERGSISRREGDMYARPANQQCFDLRMFVGSIIVDDIWNRPSSHG